MYPVLLIMLRITRCIVIFTCPPTNTSCFSPKFALWNSITPINQIQTHPLTKSSIINMAASALTLQAGSLNRLSGGQVRQVDRVINHPEYNSDHDISLLRVAVPFNLNNNVRPVALPSQGQSVRAGNYGVVSGWGLLHETATSLPNILQLIWLPVVAQDTCNAAYFGSITSNMLCAGYMAGGRDACQKDSGGPLVVNGQLIGVVSFGAGCARPNFPGVYARVPVYRNWIRTHTGI